MKHILRYGTNADQSYFSDYESCYDIVAINASMAAFAPNALALFVAKKTPEKEFFVDPMTHLFQHNKGLISFEKKVTTDESEKTPIKKSISKLINGYAATVDGYKEKDGDANYALLREKIRNTSIDEEFYKKFTKGVLDFQRNLVPDDKAKDYSEYIDYANEAIFNEAEKINFQHTPVFLVAPYFYLQSNDEWVNKNISLLKKALDLKGGDEIYAQLVISKRLFDKYVAEEKESDLSKIIEKYAEVDVSGYLVWVDDYIEHQELNGSLVKYTEMLKTLKGGSSKRVHVLYGSYFSVLLGHNDLGLVDGIAHGLEYGEARSVVPVGGGIPRAKFYLPKLHQRVDFPDMVEFLKEKKIDSKEKYHIEICNCLTCKEVIKDNVLDSFTQAFGQTKSTTIKRGERIVTLSFSTKETKDISLRHYLASKESEFKDLNSKTLVQISEDLKAVAGEYEKFLDGSYTAHLIEWADALVKILSRETK